MIRLPRPSLPPAFFVALRSRFGMETVETSVAVFVQRASTKHACRPSRGVGGRAVAAREQAASVNVIYTKHVGGKKGRRCCRESVRMRGWFFFWLVAQRARWEMKEGISWTGGDQYG